MDTESGGHAIVVDESDSRRSGDDRRDDERRRSAKGLFEVRARRQGITTDRRQSERREDAGRSRFAFWRRDKR
ncbi:MAG: hypothetical protein E2O59_09640 [Gammaproteobacteria bacterium]|nr:MAG: hypothetical protein E2O59_09640 [Gammaproteobacteria bacterium]